MAKPIKKLTLTKQTLKALNTKTRIRAGVSWASFPTPVTGDPESSPSGEHQQCSGHGAPSEGGREQ